MALSPLVLAGVAGALLVASVGVDLAFSQQLTLELEQDAQWKRVARVGLDSDSYNEATRAATVDPVDPNSTIRLRLTLDNGYPWPASRTLTLSSDGCYEGARELARVEIRAPANGQGEAIASFRAGDTAQGAFGPHTAPAPLEKGTPVYGYLNVCRGDRYLASASIPLEESE